jgi:hypothetical protein
MSRTVLFLFFSFMLVVVVLFPLFSGYGERQALAGESALILDLRRAVQDSTDDAQQAINGGSVFASAYYMELMKNWFCKRWGGRGQVSQHNHPAGFADKLGIHLRRLLLNLLAARL